MSAELFLHLSKEVEHVDERRVAKVTIVDHGYSSNGGTEVDLTTPISLCLEFGSKYITFSSSDDDSGMFNSVGLNTTHTNAWEVLMHTSQDRSHLPCLLKLVNIAS